MPKNLHRLTGATQKAINNLKAKHCLAHSDRMAEYAIFVWHGVHPACYACACEGEARGYPTQALYPTGYAECADCKQGGDQDTGIAHSINCRYYMPHARGRTVPNY